MTQDPLKGLATAAGLFYNGTNGTLTCFDIDTEFVECADQTGCGTGPGKAAGTGGTKSKKEDKHGTTKLVLKLFTSPTPITKRTCSHQETGLWLI